MREADRESTASKESRGESLRASGLGLEICKSRGSGRKEGQRGARNAFSLAEEVGKLYTNGLRNG